MDRMAPAHVYQPQLGSGIEWMAGTARLWEHGQVCEEAAHLTTTAYEFWYNLEFARTFPSVTHWWFRSAWTQRVRLTRPQGIMGESTIWGYIQFVDEQTPAQMWTMTEGSPREIAVPFPPNEAHPDNLPLRLALANLVRGVLAERVEPDVWVVVTSLVERSELEATFPLHSAAWQLEGVETPLREALCWLQGLKNS